MGSQCQACAWRGYIYISDHIYIYSEISATMGEGEAVPAAAADIKIYISGNSGSKEISTAQQKITMILKSLGIPILQVDISAPGIDDQRDIMRGSGMPCLLRYSMGRNIAGITMTLMLPMRMMCWRSFSAFQGKLQRLFLANLRRKQLRRMLRNHLLLMLP